MLINNKTDKTSFGSLTPLNKPLGVFYNKNAIIPTLIIETGVTLGRSYEANKRGGIEEASDRFIEQGTSAAVWLWGVQALQKTGEAIGKKLLKLDNLDFSVGRDILRDPIKNNKIDTKTASFKAGNLLVSTAIATYFIGFVLPKISSFISKKIGKKDSVNSSIIKTLTIEEFKNKTKKDKEISFTSLYDKALSLAHTIENNSTARMLITDTGVVAGRCKNAKSIYRKIENLFRDISSIYFYLFSVEHTVKLLNKLTKTTNIDPKVLSKTVEKLKDFDGSKEDFLKSALGSIDDNSTKDLKNLFESKEVITLEEFTKKFPDYSARALKMSELQPVFDNKRVLTYLQAKDVLSNSKISDPEFLKETFSYATKGASNNKLKFVSKKSLETMRLSMDDFIKQVYDASSGKVDKALIEKIANKNTIKNLGFYSLGTAISIFALGFLIPKVQYAITRKLTNSNERPE